MLIKTNFSPLYPLYFWQYAAPPFPRTSAPYSSGLRSLLSEKFSQIISWSRGILQSRYSIQPFTHYIIRRKKKVEMISDKTWKFTRITSANLGKWNGRQNRPVYEFESMQPVAFNAWRFTCSVKNNEESLPFSWFQKNSSILGKVNAGKCQDVLVEHRHEQALGHESGTRIRQELDY